MSVLSSIIPPPFVAWCNLYHQGFLTLEEGRQHDADNMNKHREIVNAPQTQKEKNK